MARKIRTDADIARVRRVQALRASNAAGPVSNRKRYNRTAAKREAARYGA